MVDIVLANRMTADTRPSPPDLRGRKLSGRSGGIFIQAGSLLRGNPGRPGIEVEIVTIFQ
jgi:hypothetical protein